MKSVLKYFSLSIVLFFYAISALEVNAYGIENTFFDEYDTYLKGDEQEIFSIAYERIDDDKHSVLANEIGTPFPFFIKEFIPSNHLVSNNVIEVLHYQNRPIFILHSVWII